ncbi:putative pap-specific phosphatase [Quercus suber]|uniref:Pap-specific phosphatase n=1 Tax=Quercus suber TaxID=58331 RepID=A0AAW0KM19_QUESU
MNLLYYAPPFPAVRFIHTHHHHRCRSTTTTTSPLSRARLFTVRASLPFPIQEAKYYRELEAAVDVVERACHLCVDVISFLYSLP